jgi:hypothetical protein
MGQTFYAQSGNPATTLTVGQLMNRLKHFPLTAPVVFQSPQYGSFGSNTAYTIEAIVAVTLPRTETHYPAHMHYNEEDDSEYMEEEYTEIKNEWTGVIIK